MGAKLHQSVIAAAGVVAVLISAVPVCGQARAVTLEELRRELAPGDGITLVRTTGDTFTGSLVRFGDSDLDLRLETGERFKIPISAVQSLERPRDPTLNGAIVGGVTGAVIGGAMFAYGAAVDANEMDEWSSTMAGIAAGFASLGALIGWGVDRKNSKPVIRFDRAGTTGAEVRVSPLLTTRRGVGVSVLISFGGARAPG